MADFGRSNKLVPETGTLPTDSLSREEAYCNSICKEELAEELAVT